MFEKHKAEKAARDHQAAVTDWQSQRNAYAELLQIASQFAGNTTSDLNLSSGEAVFYTVTGASLVEERSGGGHWEGRSQGVSLPVGSIGGHAVRYRVGASKGHYVKAPPVPTAIDTGTVYLTDKRMVFQGTAQTRECPWAKLIGFRHTDDGGATTFSVSNRQKPVTVHYGPKVSAAFDFRLDLALAHYRGTVDQLVAHLQDELAQIDARRPADADRPTSS